MFFYIVVVVVMDFLHSRYCWWWETFSLQQLTQWSLSWGWLWSQWLQRGSAQRINSSWGCALRLWGRVNRTREKPRVFVSLTKSQPWNKKTIIEGARVVDYKHAHLRISSIFLKILESFQKKYELLLLKIYFIPMSLLNSDPKILQVHG